MTNRVAPQALAAAYHDDSPSGCCLCFSRPRGPPPGGEASTSIATPLKPAQQNIRGSQVAPLPAPVALPPISNHSHPGGGLPLVEKTQHKSSGAGARRVHPDGVPTAGLGTTNGRKAKKSGNGSTSNGRAWWEDQMSQGTVTDRYVLGRTIGKGAYSTVTEGIHKVTTERHAVKLIKLKGDTREELAKQRDKILSEVYLTHNLRHKNLLHLSEFFVEPKKIVMVLELMRGGSLFDDVLERGGYSEAEAKKIFKQILSALDHMHNTDVIHRDIKLENLLLEWPNDLGSVKIADLGFAVQLRGGPASRRTMAGTPAYLAPEMIMCMQRQLTLDQVLTGALDMWASGVALFLLLGGYPPFEGTSSKELFTNILREEPAFEAVLWAYISEEAKDLIIQLLQKNPANRITAAEALEHPWFTTHHPAPHAPPNATNQSFEGLKRYISFSRSKSQTEGTAGQLAKEAVRDRTSSFIKPSFFLDLQNRHRDSWGSGLDRSLRRIFSKNKERLPVFQKVSSRMRHGPESHELFPGATTSTTFEAADYGLDGAPTAIEKEIKGFYEKNRARDVSQGGAPGAQPPQPAAAAHEAASVPGAAHLAAAPPPPAAPLAREASDVEALPAPMPIQAHSMLHPPSLKSTGPSPRSARFADDVEEPAGSRGQPQRAADGSGDGDTGTHAHDLHADSGIRAASEVLEHARTFEEVEMTSGAGEKASAAEAPPVDKKDLLKSHRSWLQTSQSRRSFKVLAHKSMHMSQHFGSITSSEEEEDEEDEEGEGDHAQVPAVAQTGQGHSHAERPHGAPGSLPPPPAPTEAFAEPSAASTTRPDFDAASGDAGDAGGAASAPRAISAAASAQSLDEGIFPTNLPAKAFVSRSASMFMGSMALHAFADDDVGEEAREAMEKTLGEAADDVAGPGAALGELWGVDLESIGSANRAGGAGKEWTVRKSSDGVGSSKRGSRAGEGLPQRESAPGSGPSSLDESGNSNLKNRLERRSGPSTMQAPLAPALSRRSMLVGGSGKGSVSKKGVRWGESSSKSLAIGEAEIVTTVLTTSSAALSPGDPASPVAGNVPHGSSITTLTTLAEEGEVPHERSGTAGSGAERSAASAADLAGHPAAFAEATFSPAGLGLAAVHMVDAGEGHAPAAVPEDSGVVGSLPSQAEPSPGAQAPPSGTFVFAGAPVQLDNERAMAVESITSERTVYASVEDHGTGGSRSANGAPGLESSLEPRALPAALAPSPSRAVSPSPLSPVATTPTLLDAIVAPQQQEAEGVGAESCAPPQSVVHGWE